MGNDNLNEQAEIGVIGGSGFYKMEGLENSRYIEMDTPYGKPSEKVLLGTVKGKSFAFISRHGIGHRLNPSEVNYRANLFALKMLGVKHLISVAAVGSLKEEKKPGDLVIWDQYYDNTFKRQKTYFEDGVVAHVSMAYPTCGWLSDIAHEKANGIDGLDFHVGGTLFNMEGPQFSSRGESFVYRQWGLDIIGMTQVPECKMARELELCFLPLAFVTDYDCWHEEEEPVTVEMVIECLNRNVANATKLVVAIVDAIAKDKPACGCDESLKYAIVSDREKIPDEAYKRLKPVIGKYIKRD